MGGKVYLVGCGPGSPDLLTLSAVKVLKKADVVLYDRLIDYEVLKYAKKAKKICCGKRPGEPLKQEWINKMLYSQARKNKVVVRLKNGDPMIFGRGGEELQFLLERGIDVEMIPGLSSATSVPALAKIPLTQRGISSSLTILTGHRAAGKKQKWRCLGDTTVVLMAVENLESIVRQLIRVGKSGTMPCALISEGSTLNERLIVSQLDKIADVAKRLNIKPPAVLVVGEVVGSLLDLKGRVVATFRPSAEVKRTEKLIKRAGGISRVYEICDIEPASKSLGRAASKQWDTLIFMSASGVRSAARFFNLKKFRLVAVGGTTKKELERFGCKRVLVPHTQNLDGVRKLLKGKKWGRILAFRSPLAKEKLKGAVNIVAYQIKLKNLDQAIKSYIRTKNDFTLLTSSGMLGHLLKAAGNLGLRREFVRKMNGTFVISLGENTTERALRFGITVNYELEHPTLESLLRKGGSYGAPLA